MAVLKRCKRVSRTRAETTVELPGGEASLIQPDLPRSGVRAAGKPAGGAAITVTVASATHTIVTRRKSHRHMAV